MPMLRFLLVDDNPDDRALVEYELRQDFDDIEIDRATDAASLSRCLDIGGYDLVITDYHIGWTNGLTVLESVKKHHPRCPVIMFTGTGNEEIAVEAMKAGLDDYVLKSPKHLVRLKGAVRSALEGARLRREMDERLTAERELFSGVVDGSPVATVLIDRDHKVVLWNAAAESLTLISRQHALGKPLNLGCLYPGKPTRMLADIVLDMDDEQILERYSERGIRRSKLGSEAFETTGRICVEGQCRSMIIIAKRLRGRHGEILGVIQCAQDISDRELYEKQVRQVQKMEALGTMSGGIAHHFNNILGIILGYAELAIRQDAEDSTEQECLRQIIAAGRRAKDLVKQILTFTSEEEQARRPVRIGILVQEALHLVRSSLPATIEIRQEISSDGLAKADPIQIRQMLANLCNNAFHAMKQAGGILEIAVQDVELQEWMLLDTEELKPGSYLKLTVKDTGHGIDSSIIHRIFDPYFTTRPVGEGSGMGLAVVYGIVRNHGGAIKVSSEVGNGSTFEVYFPRIEMEKPEETTNSLYQAPAGSGKILFIDDEEPLCLVTRQFLERLGYEVVATTNPVDALDIFRASSDGAGFDLVITDQTMPTMTGEQLAKEFLRMRPGIPVILCTGHSERISEVKAKSMGIREFLMKPVSLKELAETVKNILDPVSGGT